METNEYIFGLKAVADVLGIKGHPLVHYGWQHVVQQIEYLTTQHKVELGAMEQRTIHAENCVRKLLEERDCLDNSVKEVEDRVSVNPTCDGHATLKTIVAAHWEHIVSLQKRVTELEDDKEEMSDFYESLKNHHIRLNALENIIHSKPETASEPSVPVGELRVVLRSRHDHLGFSTDNTDQIKDFIRHLIAKAEGGAK